MESDPIHWRFGIDLGGTKTEIVALDPAGGIVYRHRVPTPASSYDDTVAALVALVKGAEREMGEGSVGIAAPGALSLVTGRVKNSNSTRLNDRPLKEDLERELGREIRIANDANCFALSEAVDGAGRGASIVFGVILGTGVGGGVVVNRHVLTGANAIAGEWGHNPMPLPTPGDLPLPRCYCGRAGCIEAYLSGPSLAADHARATGESFDTKSIAERAAQGDAACEATLQRYEERLARALGGAINLLDPHVIVLGGGLSSLDRLYENVPAIWGRYIFSDDVRTRLLPPVHGDSSGVRGAAWLWDNGG
ncbi:Fructokinase [Usitatibacter rugosus]|uniref:Fructokinase n=1 Tax=Usitatibacter rugosus TaxID=2732067 RepID=A0A6M4GZA5_9PROT|nr:ROK family protein [Usitatibacter rugosus]QJR11864.1 Fructokinase [Usitatibacter rugosus]